VYTSAGNAGFITGLYVIMVPFLGLLWGRRPGSGVWLGALLAAAGLYLLNEAPGLGLNIGDALVLLHEAAGALKILGAALMLTGMLAAQVQRYYANSIARRSAEK